VVSPPNPTALAHVSDSHDPFARLPVPFWRESIQSTTLLHRRDRDDGWHGRRGPAAAEWRGCRCL